MSIRCHLHKLNRRGDTIVEVMIVLAVLGMALGISYSTANRALLQARAAQENTKATEILQGQIEQLRTMSANPEFMPDGVTKNTTGYIYFQPSKTFCVDSTSQVVITTGAGFAGCQWESLYDIQILYDNNTSTFVLSASWDDVQGQGKDNVTLSYRVYPT